MKFGVCVPPKIDSIDNVVEIEQLGYSAVWFADNHLMWSDTYATAALAAARTKTLRIGTGASIVGTRIAPVTASAVASVNRLAPGRTFLTMGSGKSGWAAMGMKPAKMANLREDMTVLRKLLSGEEVDFTHEGITRPIRLQGSGLGYVDVEHPIPLYVAAGGPRSRAIAGALGDGVLSAYISDTDLVMDQVRAGAAEVGRDASLPFWKTTLINVVVLQPGEDHTSERVIEAVGPSALEYLRLAYQARMRKISLGEEIEIPPVLEPVWEEYRASVEDLPEARRHLRIFAGHCTLVPPDEARFVTPDLIRSVAIVGTPGEVIEQVRSLADGGLDELLLLPSLAASSAVLEQFSTQVMAKL